MKKFLSMVLALAMAMSLVTFAAPAAGAKDFTDDGSIQYKEAVDVISAIQIMDGYADASFNPSGTLTRGAASKIICNMILGPTTASALPTNVAPFPDVAAGSTFAGYIAYCSEHGIISGYADGNFRPADSLSGYAFLKMLLCALGYDQEIEGYQGANWRVNVAKQALGIGLDDGLVGELDGSRIVTREEAALYSFNTLQADMVEYGNKTTVAVNGATVTVGGSKATAKVDQTQSTRIQHISQARAGSYEIVQFAEEYFPDLVRNPTKDATFTGGQGKFGEPSVVWTWKGVEVGTYNVNEVKTYYKDVAVTDIYNDLNLAGDAQGFVYLNGVEAYRLNITRGNDKKLGEQTAANVTWENPATFGMKDEYRNGVLQQANVTNNPTIDTFDNCGLESRQVNNGQNWQVQDANRNWVNVNVDANGLVWKADANWNNEKDSKNQDIPVARMVPYMGREGFGNKIGDGSIIQVFHDDDTNRIVICAKSVYPGEINSLHERSNKKDAYVVVDYKDTTWLSYNVSSATYRDSLDEFETNEIFNEEDIVWFTLSEKAGDRGIGEVHRMQSLEGQLDRRVSGKSATINGTSYNYAKEIKFDFGSDSAMTYNSSYVVYLDADNNALFVKESDFAADQYALIERISIETSNGVRYSSLDANGAPIVTTPDTRSWDSNMVRLLMANGTERTVDLEGASRYRDNNNNIALNFLAGSVVRYVAQDDGTYKLYTVSGGGSQARSRYFGVENGAQYSIDSHTQSGLFAYTLPYADNHTTPVVNGVTYDVKAINTAATVSADSDTIFVIKENDNFKVYTGLRNAPNVLTSTATPYTQAYAYVTGTTNLKAKVVFIIRGVTQSTSKDVTFLAGKSRSDLFTEGDTIPYYEYLATVKGNMDVYFVSNSINNNPKQFLLGQGFNTNPNNGAVNTGEMWAYGYNPRTNTYTRTYVMNPNWGDQAWNSIILNSTLFDSDDIMTDGWFSSNSVGSYRAVGIKKTGHTDEVEIGTYKNENTSNVLIVRDSDNNVHNIPAFDNAAPNGGWGGVQPLAENCNIFFVNGDGESARITASEIRNDYDDIVYFTVDNDGEITNLFICDFEE